MNEIYCFLKRLFFQKTASDARVVALVPDFLRYRSAEDLLRLGKANDGGYLVSKLDVERSSQLISLGMGYDWSFERDFLRRKDIPVCIFDASVSLGLFYRNAYFELARLNIWGVFFNLLTAFRYLLFFRGSGVHHRPFYVSNFSDGNTLSLEDVFAETNEDQIFLKIDIEGNEYRILETLLTNQARVSGLVIEFHDCDLHLEKIKRFRSEFDLKLVHIHANNYAGSDRATEMPLVI